MTKHIQHGCFRPEDCNGGCYKVYREGWDYRDGQWAKINEEFLEKETGV